MSKNKKVYSFQEIVDLKKKIAKEFEEKEQRKWKAEGIFIELTKQLGDLARNIMLYERYYIKQRKKELKEGELKNIADELADIFFMLVRISEHYKINLEEAILEESRNALKYLGKKADF